MSNHDLRLLRSNGAEDQLQRRNILPPVVPHHLSLLGTSFPSGIPSAGVPHFPPGYVQLNSANRSKRPEDSANKIVKGNSSKSELAQKQALEKQIQFQLQQQQLLYLNALYAQQLQASGIDRRYLQLPLHLGGPPVNLRAGNPSSSQPSGLRPEHFSGLPGLGSNYVAEMQRGLYIQSEPLLRGMNPIESGSTTSKNLPVAGSVAVAETNSASCTPTTFSPNGSAFTPVTPKVKKDRLPVPKGKQRCASVPVLKSSEDKGFAFSWDKKASTTDLGQIPLKLNKSLELGSLPTPPPTQNIIASIPYSVPDIANGSEPIKQKPATADGNNDIESPELGLPQRGVVLIKAYPDSSTSPASQTEKNVTVGLDGAKVDPTDDEIAKKYSNSSLPAKKRKLFDQSDSSIPQSPMSLSPTQLNPPTQDDTEQIDPHVEQPRQSVIMANDTSQPTTKSPDAPTGPKTELQVQSEEVSSSNLPVSSGSPTLQSETKPVGFKVAGTEQNEKKQSEIHEIKPQIVEEAKPENNPTDNKLDIQEKSKTVRTISDEMQPLKKRRLKAVIADALNQNLDESYSSNYSSRNISPIQLSMASDSDTLPLAVIRDRLNQQHQDRMAPIKIHAEDKYNPLEVSHIESSLLTFKSHVSTPSTMSGPSTPSTSTPASPTPESNSQPVDSERKSRPMPTKRRPSNPTHFAHMDAEELEQLAPYMGLSGSDSDTRLDSSSESDDEFQSRAHIEANGERRKTRSPSTSPYIPNAARKRKKKSSSENKKATEKKDRKRSNASEDDHLAKFFAADAELNSLNGNGTKEKVNAKSTKKKRRTKAIEEKICSKYEKKEPIETVKDSRKRKSGIPRKLEVIDEAKMDTWETAADTEIVKNSSNDSDYLIKEHDASWYSVTCFCGQPFAGRPMIECDLCGIWVHMTCAKIKKTKVPDNYNCITCRRDSKAVKTRFRK